MSSLNYIECEQPKGQPGRMYIVIVQVFALFYSQTRYFVQVFTLFYTKARLLCEFSYCFTPKHDCCAAFHIVSPQGMIVFTTS